ncbi:MAG: ECF transporter S component [Ruminococcaceae bacterium]|nr:ECF transporter S component [Oscillospiraceae bacterium]
MAELKKSMSERREELRKLIYAALFLALAFLLPFVTGSNRALGTLISPMHIPAFLCGFICGPGWGAAVGFCAPLLRSVALGMPPAQMAICMAFELAAYGFCSGLLRRILPKHAAWIYVSLVISMVVGRVIYFAVAVRVMGVEQAFLPYFGTQFVNTWLGILIHLAIVPPIVYAIEKYRKTNR